MQALYNWSVERGNLSPRAFPYRKHLWRITSAAIGVAMVTGITR